MFRNTLAGLGLAAAVTSAAHAQMAMPSPNAPVTAVPIRDGAYWVKGGISNTAFIIGDKGVIAIDAEMFAPTARNEQAEIAKLTALPVNAIILTHSDPDHINGLPAWPAGLRIIAQENAAGDIRRVVADPHSNGFPPPPEIKDFLPTHIVNDKERLTIDGVRLVLIHTAPAHTDGDLLIYLPGKKIVFAGDLLTPEIGPYPGIHLNKHGSSLGWIASVKAMLALDADIFIAGHGDPQTRAQVEARLKVAIDRRAQIAALVAQNKSLAEIKTALNDQPLTGAAARFPTFTETTYQELTAK